MLVEYRFCNYSWIGPKLNNWSSKLISVGKVTDCSNQIIFSPIGSENRPLCVVVSTFCTLDELVIGFPRSYEECFRTILNAIEREANYYPNDANPVRSCCENHRILPVIDE